MPRRACLVCGAPSKGSRCATHQRQLERAKRVVRPYSSAERERRAAVVRAWRNERGDWCPGYGVPSHLSNDLTADHIVPVAAGGNEGGPLAVLCRACNGRKREGWGRTP